MTRPEAIAILSSRMADAPNYADYVAWLNRQADEVLLALVEGRRVHRFVVEVAA